jgi:hypothetical protein
MTVFKLMFYTTWRYCKETWHFDDTAETEDSAGAQLGRTIPSIDVECWSDSIGSILQTEEFIRNWDFYPHPHPNPSPDKFLFILHVPHHLPRHKL